MQKKVAPFLSIAGNIGSGKTTLATLLSSALGWPPFYESVEDNPYLSDFYTDMLRYSFPLQIYFLTHRYNTHRRLQASSEVSIQDRSIYEDAYIFAKGLFAQGKMEIRDYENYQNLFSSMMENLLPPLGLIYLKKSLPKLQKRIALRGRDFEQGLSPEYLEFLNGLYDKWIEEYKGPCLVLESDHLDFVNSSEDLNFLIRRMYKEFPLLNSLHPSSFLQ